MEPITAVAIAVAAWAWMSGDSEDEDEDGGFEGEGLKPLDEDEDEDFEGKKLEPLDEDDQQASKVSALIKAPPRPESFFQVTRGGPSAVTVAGQLLAGFGLNTGQNRARLIRCWTQLAWNRTRYASTMSSDSFPAYLEVDGQNLAAAWFPRNEPAAQLLAQKVSPPRGVNANGSWKGGGTSYGLIWTGGIREVNGEFICDPESEPPAWLLESIEDT